MTNIPDAYDQWLNHDAEQETALDELPRCSECDEPIQDEEAYFINGEWICQDCMSSYLKQVKDYG